jgi:hypothetical protein
MIARALRAIACYVVRLRALRPNERLYRLRLIVLVRKAVPR